MENNIVQKILEKQSSENLFEFLTQKLSISELNSLLLEIFNEKTNHLQPAQLLRSYQSNRFVAPANYDVVDFLKLEIVLLEKAQQLGFEVVESSPVAPLGCCSAMATVDQKKVISATRGTEVIADVTNLLALEIAKRKKNNPTLKAINLCAAHRHIRGQKFDLPGFTPHFKVLSLVSSGLDSGNFNFEVNALLHHIRTYFHLLKIALKEKSYPVKIRLTIFPKKSDEKYLEVFSTIKTLFQNVELTRADQSIEQNYYRDFRFKIVVTIHEQDHEIIDGGFVDWTQKLLQNKKERLLISGLGTEYFYKILKSQGTLIER